MQIQEINHFIKIISTPVIVVSLKNDRILLLNDRAEELTGYTLDNAKQLLLKDFFSHRYHINIEAIFELAKQNQSDNFSIIENEIELRRKTGRICIVNVRGNKQKIENDSLLILTVDDLSELKKQEQERNRLLQESLRIAKLADLGRLVGGISHELNNPLAILTGYIENIEFLMKQNQLSEELLKKNLSPIKSSAVRMTKIIRKMMQMIRHESVEFKNESVLTLVQETLLFLEEILNSHSIEPDIQIPADLIIRCDSTHIEQILINIITNACDALESLKENRRIKFVATEKNNTVSLKISNNGPSIHSEFTDKIFTPFFTTKPAGEGTGLGLFLCYNIMKSHSGEISFDSQPSQTTFELKFPAVAQPLPQTTPPQVLLLDSDPFFKKILVKKLQKIGFDILDKESLLTEKYKWLNLVIFNEDYMKPEDLTEITNQVSEDCLLYVVCDCKNTKTLQKKYQNHARLKFLSRPLQNSELLDIAEQIKTLRSDRSQVA